MDDPFAGVEAVFLDVGGVFHLPAHQPILDAFRRAGVDADPDRLDRAHYAGVAALAVWPDEDDGVWDAYMEAYATEVGVGPERRKEVVAELFAGFNTPGVWSRQVPGSLVALRALEATGLALAIVSNSDGTLEARLAEEGICQVGPGRGVPMAVVIDSRAVGLAKPDPAIFDIALQATGVPAGAAVHVGDAVGADVVGALAAGVRPVHLDPYGFCTDGSHPHLRALAELAPRLEEAAPAVMRARRHRGPAAAALLLLAAACGGHGGHQAGGRTVSIAMRDIAFAPDRLEVKAGETVEFVFRNTGQAEHEAVIGDEKLQESQEGSGKSGHAGGHKGSEHVSRVVLSPGRTGKLSYTFDQPDNLFIGCHVPTHWDAGMKVAITVT